MSSGQSESAQGLQKLLRDSLSEKAFRTWRADDIQHLLEKRFDSMEALNEAAVAMLQQPPGRALPRRLIDSLLLSPR